MDFLYIIFYVCMRLQFLDVETNPARGVLFLLPVVMYGAWT